MPIRRNWWEAAPRGVAMCGALGLALLAQACTKPPVVRSYTRTYQIDEQGGAKTCVVPQDLALTPGKETPVAMTVGNSGGWCGIVVSQGGHPFSAGLLTSQAQHGSVFIHTVGDNTRIDYTPDAHFTGTDAFTVRLLPGEPMIRASVTVNAS